MGTPRIYENRSTKTLKSYRGGEVGISRSANQPYRKLRFTGNFDREGTFIDPSHVLHHWEPDPRDWNALHAKLVDKVDGSTSELLTASVEWSSSLRMISARATQLRSAYRALARWDLPLVGKELLMSPADIKKAERRSLKHSQTPSSAWLEWWMGWAPMMSDMANAAKVISEPKSPERVSASIQRRIAKVAPLSVGTQVNIRARISGRGHLGAYAKVAVTNRNLYLANQLGVTNPFLTGFQVIPFSFIANWFGNFEQFLGSLNAFTGVTFYERGVGIAYDQQIEVSGWRRQWDSTVGAYVIKYHAESATSLFRERRPGVLPSVSFTVGLPKLSLTRALTSVSLLTEIFLLKKPVTTRM